MSTPITALKRTYPPRSAVTPPTSPTTTTSTNNHRVDVFSYLDAPPPPPTKRDPDHWAYNFTARNDWTVVKEHMKYWGHYRFYTKEDSVKFMNTPCGKKEEKIGETKEKTKADCKGDKKEEKHVKFEKTK